MDPGSSDRAIAEAEQAALQLIRDVKRARRRARRLVAETYAKLLMAVAPKPPRPEGLARDPDRASSQETASEPVRSDAA